MAENNAEARTAGESQTEEEILTEIRDDFRYVKAYWDENYDEAEKDMDCVACIPPADFKDDRAGRPCIWPDEISQYVNAVNNNLRQNKRSVEVSPRQNNATDKDAEDRRAYIRGIEYASKAQSIYMTAAESAVRCAFGFWRLTLIVTGPNGEQEPRIQRIPNWATVYMDPDALEADFSDGDLTFVTDTMRSRTFANRWGHLTKKVSFTGADEEKAPGWISGDNVTVAEAWKRKKIVAKDGETTYEVTQRITNGLEILETNRWIGSRIPIIGTFGEELYVRNGTQSKRVFLSLIRRARHGQQMLAYIASQQAEEFQMMPRAPLQGWKGTFDSKQHSDLHRKVKAYVEYKIPADWNAQWGPPPLPTRTQFSPNADAYANAYEQWRRQIQAATGNNPLPTAAQRQNEKSGVALERIQDAEAVGSLHFTDNFERALVNNGWQLNELITKLAETHSLPDELLGRNQKDEDVKLHVARYYKPGDTVPPENSQRLPEAELFFAHRGQFEIGISSGPSRQSEREEISAFADKMLETIPQLGLSPQITQAVLAICIKLKNIGTYGNEIADLLSPPDPNNLPPQARAILAQKDALLQKALSEVQQLKLEKLGKVTEIHGKMALASQEHAAALGEANMDRMTKIEVAEIMTKAQVLSERMQGWMDTMSQFHEQAHELAMQMQAQGHALQLAKQNAAMQPPPGAAVAPPAAVATPGAAPVAP